MAGAGCSTPASFGPVGATPKSCLYEPGHGIFLEPETKVFRQGATISIRPKSDQMPFGYRDIETRCITEWRVTGAARLAHDRSSLTIASDAQIGGEVTITFEMV
jgi:hypothetical protein